MPYNPGSWRMEFIPRGDLKITIVHLELQQLESCGVRHVETGALTYLLIDWTAGCFCGCCIFIVTPFSILFQAATQAVMQECFSLLLIKGDTPHLVYSEQTMTIFQGVMREMLQHDSVLEASLSRKPIFSSWDFQGLVMGPSHHRLGLCYMQIIPFAGKYTYYLILNQIVLLVASA